MYNRSYCIEFNSQLRVLVEKYSGGIEKFYFHTIA